MAGLLALALLAVVQAVVDPPMLLAERFLPGAGWIEIVALAAYASLVARGMTDPARSPRVRVWVWRLFSLMFFSQLGLGLLGCETCLMTGELHLPVPALILAGPVFRGGGLFMIVLFGVTVVLVGPAWCSHLCYIGAWDDVASRRRKKPGRMPAWRRPMHVAVLAAVLLAALGMRIAGVEGAAAAAVAGVFGLVGVGIMAVWSRRTGVMTHCTAWCPVGVAATWLGRVSPFRIAIDEGCTRCGKCRLACRYDALTKQDIERRRVAISCTLCGDCVERCEGSNIGYRLPGLSHGAARTVFITLAAALHAVFLGVARI